MKKTYLILSLITILFSCSDESVNSLLVSDPESLEESNVLTVDEAKALLLDFMSDQIDTKAGETFTIGEYNIRDYHVAPIKTRTTNDDPEVIPIYEFATESNKNNGYAVVIGDKRIEKVLVSVEKGEFSDTLIIQPLRSFFQSIPSFIQSDLNDYYTDVRNTPKRTRAAFDTYYNFLPTIWGQGYPYNSKCPVANCYDGHYPAGCVAIAIAQILAFHKIPANLNWTSILSSSIVTSSSSQTIRDEVGTLIAEIGTKVEMNYGCSGSGVAASVAPQKIPYAFSQYGFTYGAFQNFSLNLVTESLVNGRPLYMQGQSDEGGHGWVCDSWKRHNYDDGTFYDYLNMNWGWNGSSNGFYYVSNPVSFNTGHYTFYYNMKILPNIRII